MKKKEYSELQQGISQESTEEITMKTLLRKTIVFTLVLAMTVNVGVRAKAATVVSQNYTWNLVQNRPAGLPSNLYPGAVTSSYKTENNTGAPMKKHISTCSTFSSNRDDQNNTSYVTYTVKLADANGTVYSTSPTLYHTGANTFTHTFAADFVYGKYCHTKYRVSGATSVFAYFGGNFHFSN